ALVADGGDPGQPAGRARLQAPHHDLGARRTSVHADGALLRGVFDGGQGSPYFLIDAVGSASCGLALRVAASACWLARMFLRWFAIQVLYWSTGKAITRARMSAWFSPHSSAH